jgi:hypothetical protein
LRIARIQYYIPSELRELLCEVIGADLFSLKPLQVCCCCATTEVYLRVGPKIKDFIEDPFRYETWLGGVRVRLHGREQGTTTASGVCECYYLVYSLVF